MKWRKLGRTFDPRGHALPNGCKLFAQSPQALVMEDGVRIYFSTRSVDPDNGKFRSHICFVDMDHGLHDVRHVASTTVIPLGALGCFDEHGIFPMNVVRDGPRVVAYTCGWSRRVAVSVETAIGRAVSMDGGKTFQREGEGPVLTASLHEPCLVGDPFVLWSGGRWHMWYIFGTGWRVYKPGAAPDRTYKIGHAISDDGVKWVKEDGVEIVASVLGAEESQALPTVVEINGTFHMFFCYRQSFDFRQNRDRGYRIGHASSLDLRTWTRNDAELFLDVTPGDWDSDMLCYPHVFQNAGRVFMLYNGNEFGKHGFGAAILE